MPISKVEIVFYKNDFIQIHAKKMFKILHEATQWSQTKVG